MYINNEVIKKEVPPINIILNIELSIWIVAILQDIDNDKKNTPQGFAKTFTRKSAILIDTFFLQKYNLLHKLNILINIIAV